jgi:hypothetical protein
MRRFIVGIGFAVALSVVGYFGYMRLISVSAPRRSDHVRSAQLPVPNSTIANSPDPGVRSKAPDRAITTREVTKVIAAPKSNPMQSFDQLVKGASDDHGETAFALYRLLRVCKAKLFGTSSDVRPDSDFDASRCEQITDSRMDFMSWLRRSRDMGYLPAIAEFAYLPRNEIALPNATAQERAEDRKKMDVALRAAVKAGSVDAMLLLGTSYFIDRPDQQSDRVTGYAYILAASQGLSEGTKEVTNPNWEIPSASQIVKQRHLWLEGMATSAAYGLSKEQLDRAVVLKDSIIASSECCVLIERM